MAAPETAAAPRRPVPADGVKHRAAAIVDGLTGRQSRITNKESGAVEVAGSSNAQRRRDT